MEMNIPRIFHDMAWNILEDLVMFKSKLIGSPTNVVDSSLKSRLKHIMKLILINFVHSNTII